MKTFYLVIVDEDKKIYAIEGPMTDDTEWNRRIVEEQEAGRRVRCFSGDLDNAENLKKWEAEQVQKGYKKVATTDILLPPSYPGYKKH